MRPPTKQHAEYARQSSQTLRDTEPPVFCRHCGVVKKEFQNPGGHVFYSAGARYTCGNAERIQVLPCTCEKERHALSEWYKLQIEIYGADYEAWRRGARGSKLEHHFRAIERARAELDSDKSNTGRR